MNVFVILALILAVTTVTGTYVVSWWLIGGIMFFPLLIGLSALTAVILLDRR